MLRELSELRQTSFDRMNTRTMIVFHWAPVGGKKPLSSTWLYSYLSFWKLIFNFVSHCRNSLYCVRILKCKIARLVLQISLHPCKGGRILGWVTIRQTVTRSRISFLKILLCYQKFSSCWWFFPPLISRSLLFSMGHTWCWLLLGSVGDTKEYNLSAFLLPNAKLVNAWFQMLKLK